MDILSEFDKSVNTLDLRDKVGHTDYIDFIDVENLKKPVYTGTDYFRRKFVTMRVIVTKGGEEIEYAQTFFQRYTDGEMIVSGRVVGRSEFMDTCGGMKDEELFFIKKLIEGETVSGVDIPYRCLRAIGGWMNSNIDPDEYKIRLGDPR